MSHDLTQTGSDAGIVSPVVSRSPNTTESVLRPVDARGSGQTVLSSTDSSPLRSAARQQWIDSAKGMCILFIVVCHCLRGLAKSGIIASDTALYQIWDNYFYTFQVPVFFFVSGLFARRSYDKLGFNRFLLTKLDALAYPYVVWQTLLLLLLILSQGTANRVATPGQLLWFPLFPQALFWFVYTLIIVLVIYALARRVGLPDAALLALSIGILFLPRLDLAP